VSHQHGTPPALDTLGQRPLFSDPTEDNVPDTTNLPAETRLDDASPIDRSLGNADTWEPAGSVEDITEVLYRFGTFTSPPTASELDSLLGIQRKIKGFIGIARRSGQAFLVICDGTDWWYEQMTQAV
jgi:hypothetical protein